MTGPVESGWGVGRTGRGAGGEQRGEPHQSSGLWLAGASEDWQVGPWEDVGRRPGAQAALRPQLAPLTGWSGRKTVAWPWVST